MTPSDLTRALREFAARDPHAAARAEHASVLAAALAIEVGTDPILARASALAAFGVGGGPSDASATRVAAAACEAVLDRLDPSHEWYGIVQRLLDVVTPLGEPGS